MRRLLYLVSTDAYFLSHRLPLAKAAQKEGYEILVATKVTEHAEAIEKEGFTLIPLKRLKRTGLNPFADFWAFLEILCIYRRFKPDLVHHVALKPVLYGGLAAFLAKVPAKVYALTGLGYVFISEKRSMRLIRFFVMAAFRFLFRRPASTLILQNQDDYAKFQRDVPAKNLALIRGSGVDTKRFAPVENKPQNEPMKVALVARMLWDKGVEEAVMAVRILQEEGICVTLLLCGDPDLENPSAIPENTLRYWNKKGYCQWLTHQDDIAGLYQSVDVAILPSYREGLPKSLIEAAACGLPIITTDVPGCREVVDINENGILVPPHDSHTLSHALKEMVQNPYMRRTMEKKSRAKAVKEFAVERIVKETLAVYQSLQTHE